MSVIKRNEETISTDEGPLQDVASLFSTSEDISYVDDLISLMSRALHISALENNSRSTG
jgi:hypothetical protein